MSTVAYVNGELVGDRRCTENGVILGLTRKVFKVQAEFEGEGPTYLVGIVGNATYIPAFLNFIRGGFRKADKPKVPDGEDGVGIIEALVIDERGKVCFYTAPEFEPEEIEAPQYALGSGAKFAKAAMHLGHSALQAVLTAAHFDVYTGPETDTVTF